MNEEVEDKDRLTRLSDTEHAKIDSKGRVLLSRDKRFVLKPNFCVTVGSTGCLELMPREKWEAMADMIESYDALNQGRKQMARLFFGQSIQRCNCDPEGRLTLPEHIRLKAKLDKDVTIVGCGSYCEIWDKATYQEYESKQGEYHHANMLAYESAYLKMNDRWPELPKN